MRELDECLQLCKKIKKQEDRITEVRERACAAKIQIITDMPRGGGVQASKQEAYLLSIEKIEERKKKLSLRLAKKWEIAKSLLIEQGFDKEVINLLHLRFCKGYKWRKCAEIMSRKNKRWNVNKCFRVYRAVLHKIDKK